MINHFLINFVELNISITKILFTKKDEIISSSDEWSESTEYTESSTESQDDDELYDVDDITNEETLACDFLSSVLNSYSTEEEIFTPVEMHHYREKERGLMERFNEKYYRCKVKHQKLYEDMKIALEPYLTSEMLSMLNHTWDTQVNEGMNNSVAAYAPKNRHYSATGSLKSRVAVAAGVQIVGYYKYWKAVFEELNLLMDEQLTKHLKSRDEKREMKDKYQKSKKGKTAKSKSNFRKLHYAQQQYQDAVKGDTAYQSGIALKSARGAVKKRARKSREIEDAEGNKTKICIYHHPNFCTKTGHDSARHPYCFAHNKSDAERKQILKLIFDGEVADEVKNQLSKGMWEL